MTKINKPEPGKIYALTGGIGDKTIAAGNTWAEAEVTDKLKTMTFINIDENGATTKEVGPAELYTELKGVFG